MDLLFHLWLILISQRVLLFKRTGNSHSSLQLFSSQMQRKYYRRVMSMSILLLL